MSIASESERPVVEGTLEPLSHIIADVNENFEPRVAIPFPRRYVRFVRYRRQVSVLDEDFLASFVRGQYRDAPPGTIAEFELFAEGVPHKAIYKTSITDLGQSVNFGRLFWRTTPLRMVDETPVETPDAAVGVKIEVRTGRDGDPAVYHEYMETGFERVVSRERYENELHTRQFRPNLESPIVTLEPRPGLRASIGYDDENWTFWSVPFTQPGLPLNLRSGSYLQLRIALESRSFDDFVRLDSLWIETAPLLAGDIVVGILYHLGPHLLGLAILHTYYDRLADRAVTSVELAAVVFVLFLATDKGFVYLDRAVQHGSGDLVGLADAVQHESR